MTAGKGGHFSNLFFSPLSLPLTFLPCRNERSDGSSIDSEAAMAEPIAPRCGPRRHRRSCLPRPPRHRQERQHGPTLDHHLPVPLHHRRL